MHIGRHYTLKEVIVWTRRETAIFVLVGTVPTIAYAVFGCTWLTVSWPPIAFIGTAVAFVTGFKNSASYARLWEARQIWAGIMTSSRAWGLQVLDFVSAKPAAPPATGVDVKAVRRRLIYRQLAWLTVLRYQLRRPMKWENMNKRANKDYRKHYRIPEWEDRLEDDLSAFLPAEEQAGVFAMHNPVTQLIVQQSRDLNELSKQGLLGEVHRLELTRTLVAFFDHQAKVERIKNSPYPRQFATLNLIFVWMFVLLVPFGLLHEFQKVGPAFVWVTIPASVLISWVLHTIDKIGSASENPFEGSPNDLPITALSRVAEIDLREMLGEQQLPPPARPVNDILM